MSRVRNTQVRSGGINDQYRRLRPRLRALGYLRLLNILDLLHTAMSAIGLHRGINRTAEWVGSWYSDYAVADDLSADLVRFDRIVLYCVFDAYTS